MAKKKSNKETSSNYKDMYPNGGRPPTFEGAEDMQKAIHRYFQEGVTVKQVIIGKKPNQTVVLVPVPTITGLVLYIGFESRTSFYEYEKKEGFMYTVKKARAFIEREYEEQLQTGNTVGAIFALKNMGWIDKMEVDQNINDKRKQTDELFPPEEELNGE